MPRLLRPMFTVQKYLASQLYYDFRPEIIGGKRTRATCGSGTKGTARLTLLRGRIKAASRSVPVRNYGGGIPREGIINDLSLSGSHVTGNAPVSIGTILTLHLFVSGDPEPLLIPRVTVQWIKGTEFGVDFWTPPLKMAGRLTQLIAMLVKMQKDSPRKE